MLTQLFFINAAIDWIVLLVLAIVILLNLFVSKHIPFILFEIAYVGIGFLAYFLTGSNQSVIDWDAIFLSNFFLNLLITGIMSFALYPLTFFAKSAGLKDKGKDRSDLFKYKPAFIIEFLAAFVIILLDLNQVSLFGIPYLTLKNFYFWGYGFACMVFAQLFWNVLFEGKKSDSLVHCSVVIGLVLALLMMPVLFVIQYICIQSSTFGFIIDFMASKRK